MGAGLDYQGDNVPDNFYVPVPSQEQVEADALERSLHVLQMPLVEEFLADVQDLLDTAENIRNINLDSRVNPRVQIYGMQMASELLTPLKKKYAERLKRAQDALNAPIEEPMA